MIHVTTRTRFKSLCSSIISSLSPGDTPGTPRYLLFFNYFPGDTPGTPDTYFSLEACISHRPSLGISHKPSHRRLSQGPSYPFVCRPCRPQRWPVRTPNLVLSH